MVCWAVIKEREKRLGRKLTLAERAKIEKMLHHNESHEHESEGGEEEVNCLCQ